MAHGKGSSNVAKVKVAHCVKIEDGQPAPQCQQEGCVRRAQYMYRDSQGFKVYRPWCEADRPIRGKVLGPITPRPRPYRALNQAWDEKEKCPFCHRKREPRQPGILRPTCREHRGMTTTGERRKQGRPATTVKKVRVTRATPPPKPKTAVRTAKPTKLNRPPANPYEVTYREGGKSFTTELPPEDMIRLKALHSHDVGHYPAATDKKLTRKYPTALIAALWYRWTR